MIIPAGTVCEILPSSTGLNGNTGRECTVVAAPPNTREGEG